MSGKLYDDNWWWHIKYKGEPANWTAPAIWCVYTILSCMYNTPRANHCSWPTYFQVSDKADSVCDESIHTSKEMEQNYKYFFISIMLFISNYIPKYSLIDKIYRQMFFNNFTICTGEELVGIEHELPTSMIISFLCWLLCP